MAEIVERAKSFGETAKKAARPFLRHENTILVAVLAALVAIFAYLSKGITVRPINVENIIVQSSSRGIAAVGQAFVVLSGSIDLSVGGLGLITSIVGAGLMTEELYLNFIGHPVSPLIVLPLMIAIGVGCGAVNGLIVSRIGVSALVATLGTWNIYRGLAYNIGGGQSIAHQPEFLSFFGQGEVGGVATPIIIFVGVCVSAYFILYHTPFGRSVYAVGGNSVSAWLSGVNVKRVSFSVFLISGFLAALSSIVMMARVMCASMRTLEGLELDSIAAVFVGGVSLLGGKGSLIGVILGAMIIGIINNGLGTLGVGPDVWAIVKGVIIITAVAVDQIRRR
jgi:ribose/xylose/arabinose/galactoside ABC-type transport system permease subunit